MKRIGMGIVGTGFIGPHHIDAVRRLGFVDIVALAEMNDTLAKQKAEALNVPKGYGSYEALLDDPAVQVVHNATPNFLHYPVNAAAIAKGKHIVSDKPLALTADEARKLRDQAKAAGVVNAVTFSYRGNPLVQQMRHAIAGGKIGTPRFIYGQYVQDWLLKDTDYSWRLEPEKGGVSSALGDIGSHWCDLAQHVSGLRFTEVLG
ncbi:MAG TPA: Gfo/Idh/MocA family oxidoreductase, partial [Vicinamibacterales bacterium]|nr:Gfo/Idh/MocA family oxidoreductase [Vicinamibacterales bacterium]